MVDAGTSGVYYNCSGGSADNYTFEHSGNAAVTIRQTTAQLQITSNVLTATYGQKIDFTVHLVNNSGIAVDAVSIQISSGDVILGNCTLGDLSRNKCGITSDVLQVGDNTVTASWNGPADVNFAVPTPATMHQPVVKAGVGITVTSNHNPANPSQSIILTATVTGTSTPPTGSVTFVGGINEVVAECSPVIGTNRSVCDAEVGTLNPDVYHVEVSYSGDDNYEGNGTTYIQIVQFASTGVNIAPANETSTYGDSVEFTVTVPGDAEQNPTAWPTGRVTITDNNRVYSVGCDLVHIPESVDSSCVITVTGMELGQHQILASYAGDSIFPSSNDLTGHHVVIDTTTSISSSKNAANVGDSVTLTATVSSVRGTPTSSVISFREDGNEIASCNIYGGTCSVTFAYSSAFTGGLHNIVAVFLPGEASDFRTSTSGILEQQINELIATVTLTQSTETSFVGQRTNFTVSVAGSANIPTGSVRIDIKANETVVESLTCTLTNGLCSAGTSTLAAGTYSVTATYLGEETGYPSATSDAITHAVVLKGTSVSISSSKNPSLYGDTITLTSTVTSEHGIPSSGSIRFESDGNEIATCNVSGGTCSITTNALAIGSHEVIAYFIPTEGSAFEAANSPTLTQDVQALQVIAVTVTSNLNPSLVGQIVTFTVNVTGNGYLPKGPASIDVVDRGTGLLYETLDCVVVNGRCSVSTSDLEAGEYDVTAHYQGDASLGDAGYPAADSDSEAILKQVVNEPSLLVTSRESETHHTNLPTGDSLITLSVAISGNAGPITGTVSFYLDGAIEDTVFAHAQYIGTGTCTRQRLTNPVSYTANCQIKVLASVLHALNPTVRNHYVTVSYNGSTYGSVSVLRDGSGVSSVLHEIANAVADNHTVTFDKNAADAVDPTPEASDTQTANATTVLTPNSYTRAGYTFDGWASSSDGVVIYAPGTTYPFTEDTTLFAHWTANPSAPVLADHTVTFDKNAADATGATPNQTTNTPTALTLNGFTRDGYTFAGWTTNADGTGDSYLNGATYSFTADKTMFAKWTLNGAASHTVIFNPNAMVPGSTPNQSASSPTALTLNGFTRSGYTFDGWATSSLGAVVYANGATYSFDADITLFAHWTVIAAANHTVNFNGNSVDSLGSMTPQTSNSFTQLTANSFSRAGYVFDGWASTPSGALAFNNQASYSFASDTTLYARWAIDNHTVTFDGNGATSGSMSPQVSNVPTVLTVNAFSRTNFTFDGWATSAGGAVVYAPGIYGFAADITLFAKWSANYVAPAPAPYVPPTPSQTTPILAWANPASIVVGTALSATQLNATVVSPAGLSGTFSYSPALASLLAAGTYTLTVTFTPTDTTNYTVATKTVTQIVTPLGTTPVGPGTPTAATINLGDGSGTYDTTGHEAPVSISPANCTYTVTYNGSTTVPVNAGSYNVIVTATGNCTGTATRTLVIAKATPNVDWLDPADITTTTPLGSNELNATADVPGKFAYSPAAKRLLPAGTQTLNATFTPTDSANYESVNITASINVTAAILSQTLVSFFSLASSTIPADQLLIISAASITPGQQIVITGYAQPSKSAAADLKLGLARANAVKAQILKKNPKAKITVKTLGAKYQPLCAAAKNKCVVVVLK